MKNLQSIKLLKLYNIYNNVVLQAHVNVIIMSSATSDNSDAEYKSMVSIYISIIPNILKCNPRSGKTYRGTVGLYRKLLKDSIAVSDEE